MFELGHIGTIGDIGGEARWSAAELRGAVAKRAKELAGLGVSHGDRVVITHGGTPAFFVDLFAVWANGACAACVNPDLTEGELANVSEFTEPSAVLTADGGAEPDAASDPGTLQIGCGEGDDALILFTSGTTGDPKGVVHSFGSLGARIALNHEYISAETLSRTLCVLPTHFGHGLIGNCLTPLFAGGDLFLAGAGGLAVAAKLGEHISANEITFMSSVPAFWKMTLKLSKPPARRSLRQVSVGSAPVAAELVQAIAEWSGTDDVRNMYGITETANWISGSSARDRAPEDGLIGEMWGGKAGVRLEDGTIAEQGEGEIVIQTPSLMKGYWRRPDLFEAAVQDGWYRTGDTGSVGADGIIRLGGRIKNEINRGGMKVSPEEVDLLLERHPAIVEACAFGLPDDIAGEIVAVAIQSSPNAGVEVEALRNWCAERIRRECVPERWFFLDEIPKTDRGKLNRDRVREACLLEAVQ